MKYNANAREIGIGALTFFLIGAPLLLLLAVFASSVYGQSTKPLYSEYRGVHIGMTATEARAKLGEPTMKSDDQDFYVFSTSETAQIVYDTAQKVVTISTDYMGGVGAPDYKAIVGEGLVEKPDGSLFRMVRFPSEHFWVTYNKSATVVPTVTITIGAMK
jgi:hypothetical protein